MSTSSVQPGAAMPAAGNAARAPRASVIIPTFNRATMLRQTLESLIRQELEHAAYEIIVVDNNSSDDTAAVVQELAAHSPVEIRYLHERRPGVHYARNLAARHARASILYFTDDDMIADRRMLAELLKPFALDPDIAVVTGRVLPKWERQPPAWVERHCSNMVLSLQLRAEELIISRKNPGVNSCHEGIRKEVLLECGGFNPENTGGLWVGDGETGLNRKVEARGYKFAFTGKAVTHHVIPATRMTQRYLNTRMANEGNADAFTWFRAERPDDSQLARAELVAIWKCGREAVSVVSAMLRGRDTWRVHRARISYFRARLGYCRRLRQSASWRAFVLRDDWIHEDADAVASQPTGPGSR